MKEKAYLLDFLAEALHTGETPDEVQLTFTREQAQECIRLASYAAKEKLVHIAKRHRNYSLLVDGKTEEENDDLLDLGTNSESLIITPREILLISSPSGYSRWESSALGLSQLIEDFGLSLPD